MRHRARLGAIFCIVSALTISARAQTNSRADLDAANIHFQAGSEHYARGQYDDAIKEFQEAYRLSKAAALLYNISQAYERAGDFTRARDYLGRYIDSGQTEAGEMPKLLDKRNALDHRIAEEAVTATAHPTITNPVLPAAPPRRSRPLKTWKWIAGGAGVAMAGVAAAFLIDAGAMNDKIETAANQMPLAHYDGALQDAYARGQRDNTLAAVFGAAGVLALGTSVVLFVLDRGDTRERTVVVAPTVAPSGGGGAAGASLIWRF
jgi:tetratricopeptide (TPR) repeat protein